MLTFAPWFKRSEVSSCGSSRRSWSPCSFEICLDMTAVLDFLDAQGWWGEPTSGVPHTSLRCMHSVLLNAWPGYAKWEVDMCNRVCLFFGYHSSLAGDAEEHSSHSRQCWGWLKCVVSRMRTIGRNKGYSDMYSTGLFSKGGKPDWKNKQTNMGIKQKTLLKTL